MDIPAIAVEMHRSVGFAVGRVDLIDLVVAHLGSEAVTVVPARYEDCDPLRRTGDAFAIRIAESVVSDAAKLDQELAFGLSLWRLRGVVNRKLRVRSAHRLAVELLNPSGASSQSGTVLAARPTGSIQARRAHSA